MLEETPITEMRDTYQAKADDILFKHLDDSILKIQLLTNKGCNIEENINLEVAYIKNWLKQNSAQLKDKLLRELMIIVEKEEREIQIKKQEEAMREAKEKDMKLLLERE